VVTKLQRLLNRRGLCLNGAEILILGVTYKADVADPRETPAVKVMELLQREGARLSYTDPYTPSLDVEGHTYVPVDVTAERLAQSDCALILTAHSAFDYELIVRQAPLVFDTRNGTRSVSGSKANVVLL
jgi:UDP-N-acetyl-D-glucosamine dehydrogenase